MEWINIIHELYYPYLMYLRTYLLNANQLILYSICFSYLQLNHFYVDGRIVIVYLGDLRE